MTDRNIPTEPESLQQQCANIAKFYEEKPGLQGSQAVIDLYRVCGALATRVQKLEDRAASCQWKADDNGDWHTDCGEIFVIVNGSPLENSMKFCCYCGKRLDEVPYEEPEEDESVRADDVGGGLKAAEIENACTHEFRRFDSAGQRWCIYCNEPEQPTRTNEP